MYGIKFICFWFLFPLVLVFSAHTQVKADEVPNRVIVEVDPSGHPIIIPAKQALPEQLILADDKIQWYHESDGLAADLANENNLSLLDNSLSTILKRSSWVSFGIYNNSVHPIKKHLVISPDIFGWKAQNSLLTAIKADGLKITPPRISQNNIIIEVVIDAQSIADVEVGSIGEKLHLTLWDPLNWQTQSIFVTLIYGLMLGVLFLVLCISGWVASQNNKRDFVAISGLCLGIFVVIFSSSILPNPYVQLFIGNYDNLYNWFDLLLAAFLICSTFLLFINNQTAKYHYLVQCGFISVAFSVAMYAVLVDFETFATNYAIRVGLWATLLLAIISSIWFGINSYFSKNIKYIVAVVVFWLVLLAKLIALQQFKLSPFAVVPEFFAVMLLTVTSMVMVYRCYLVNPFAEAGGFSNIKSLTSTTSQTLSISNSSDSLDSDKQIFSQLDYLLSTKDLGFWQDDGIKITLSAYLEKLFALSRGDSVISLDKWKSLFPSSSWKIYQREFRALNEVITPGASHNIARSVIEMRDASGSVRMVELLALVKQVEPAQYQDKHSKGARSYISTTGIIKDVSVDNIYRAINDGEIARGSSINAHSFSIKEYLNRYTGINASSGLSHQSILQDKIKQMRSKVASIGGNSSVGFVENATNEASAEGEGSKVNIESSKELLQLRLVWLWIANYPEFLNREGLKEYNALVDQIRGAISAIFKPDTFFVSFSHNHLLAIIAESSDHLHTKMLDLREELDGIKTTFANKSKGKNIKLNFGLATYDIPAEFDDIGKWLEYCKKSLIKVSHDNVSHLPSYFNFTNNKSPDLSAGWGSKQAQNRKHRVLNFSNQFDDGFLKGISALNHSTFEENERFEKLEQLAEVGSIPWWRREFKYATESGSIGLVSNDIIELSNGTVSGVSARLDYIHPLYGSIAPQAIAALARVENVMEDLLANIIKQSVRQWNLSSSAMLHPNQFFALIDLPSLFLKQTDFNCLKKIHFNSLSYQASFIIDESELLKNWDEYKGIIKIWQRFGISLSIKNCTIRSAYLLAQENLVVKSVLLLQDITSKKLNEGQGSVLLAHTRLFADLGVEKIIAFSGGSNLANNKFTEYGISHVAEDQSDLPS